MGRDQLQFSLRFARALAYGGKMIDYAKSLMVGLGIGALALAGCQVSSTGNENDAALGNEVAAPDAAEPVLAPPNEADPAEEVRIIAAPRVPPIDTCRQTGSFPAFRKAFETAVAERDFALLEPLIAYDIQTDFGGGGGMEDFANHWRGSAWKTSKLWDELDKVIALGCGGGEGYFAMPRMFVADMGEVDSFDALVALGEAVPLYSAASDTSDVLARLDWAVVQQVTGEDARPTSADWTEVKAGDGTVGFVESALLRSPIDYRAVFQWRKTQWKMTAFIAGD